MCEICVCLSYADAKHMDMPGICMFLLFLRRDPKIIRTGSQWLVVEVFGEKGRQHRSADSNPEMVEKMAARYRHAAELHWSATLAEIERVKRLYQTKIKKSKK